MLAISYLSHVYLGQYNEYFPRFSYFTIILVLSRQNFRSLENIGHIVLRTVR